MPNTEKQMTAMTTLRSKLFTEAEDIKEDAKTDQYSRGYRNALLWICNDIDIKYNIIFYSIIMDLRIEHIFKQEMGGDTSFKEKESGLSLLFGSTKYSKQEMKETWNRGIKHGIEIGLRKSSLEGQRIELNQNIDNEKHKEFIEKFYKLADEYKCAIQYHPQLGMVIVSKEQYENNK